MTETKGQDESYLLSPADVRFRRNEQGDVIMETGGRTQVVARVISAFPLTHFDGMVSLRDEQGREIAILEAAGKLDDESLEIVTEALERSYFMPRIVDISDITERLNVVEWDIETDRGPRAFQVRHVRQNIRRIGPRRFMIKDVDGNRYEIRDWLDLPPAAQRQLEPYL